MAHQCSVCNGRGVITCTRCGGHGTFLSGETCTTCHGDKVMTCPACKGSGRID